MSDRGQHYELILGEKYSSYGMGTEVFPLILKLPHLGMSAVF